MQNRDTDITSQTENAVISTRTKPVYTNDKSV